MGGTADLTVIRPLGASNCFFEVIYIEKKDIFPIADYDNWYVVTDFDRTITNGHSMTSWSVLANSNLVSEDYIHDRDVLYKKYRPIEIDESMDFSKRCKLVSEWFLKHIQLFIKYQVKEELFLEAASNHQVMEFRKGAKEFLEFLNEHHVPVIIISAGIGNFIKLFLESNNCYYDNIYISSNMICFRDGIASFVEGSIIHSLNKNEVSLPDDIKNTLSKRNKVILLGDQISDLRMVDDSVHDEVLKIGFVTDGMEDNKEQYNKYFDLVYDIDEDYYDVMKDILGKVDENGKDKILQYK